MPADLAESTATISSLQAQVADLTAAKDQLQAQLASALHSHRHQMATQVAHLKQEAADLQQQSVTALSSLQADNDRLQAQLDGAYRKLYKAKLQQDKVTVDKVKLQSSLDVACSKLNMTSLQRDELQASLASAQQEAAAELAEARKEMLKASDRLSTYRTKLQSGLDDVCSLLDSAKVERGQIQASPPGTSQASLRNKKPSQLARHKKAAAVEKQQSVKFTERLQAANATLQTELDSACSKFDRAERQRKDLETDLQAGQYRLRKWLRQQGMRTRLSAEAKPISCSDKLITALDVLDIMFGRKKPISCLFPLQV